MKHFFKSFLILFFTFSSLAQTAPQPYGVTPSDRQLRWHEMEMYGLIHFGLNTYQDKEWGYGDGDPQLFNPVNFDAEQIVKAAKSGGLKGLILVAKHHDGFCLWPTKTTEYNISKSLFRNGKGDMVREFEQACRKHGLKFGLYNSPWDRNAKSYGSPEYIDLYRAQWKELYENYGELFASWHDGANGGDGFYGGAKESRKIDRTTYYGWNNFWSEFTRKLQPNAVIFSDIGLDIRWVGNEKGIANETHWATFTPTGPKGEANPGPGFANDHESPTGHRNGKYWIPAECDVPLRPGWFYHQNQDAKVKTPAQLLEIYFKSVGRGADLDLGLAPDQRGLLHENDVKSLTEFGANLQKTFLVNFATGAKIKASNVRGKEFAPTNLLDADRYSYWATDDKVTTPEILFTLKKAASFNVIRLRENIKLGQRVEAFAVDAMQDGSWKEIASATSIGANRLIKMNEKITTNQVRIRITKSLVCVALSDFGLFAIS